MEQLLQSVSGGQVSVPMTIVISGIAKMFVGELVEIGTQHSTYVSLCIPYISLAKGHSHGFFTFKTIFLATPIDILLKEENRAGSPLCPLRHLYFSEILTIFLH